MKKLQSSVPLKVISYILVPILALNILINAFSISYYENYREEIEGQITYFETERFSEDFLRNIYRNTNNWLDIEDNEEEEVKQTNEDVIVLNDFNKITVTEEIVDDFKLREENINYYSSGSKYEYLVIDELGNAYTNVEKTIETDTVEEIKKYILAKNYFWSYENNEVKTSVSKMEYEKIAYNSYFERIKDLKATVYSAVGNEQGNEFYKYNIVYVIVSSTYQYAGINICLSSTILILIALYIIMSIGHKKGEEGIYTNSIDNIPLEILGIVFLGLAFVEGYILLITLDTVWDATILSNTMIDTMIMFSFLVGIALYATIAVAGVSFIRRIKAKVFWKNTIIYKLIKWIKANTTDVMFANLNNAGTLIVIFGVFLVVQIIFLVLILAGHFIFVLGLIVSWYIAYKKMLEYLNDITKIRETIKAMYKGNVEQKIDENIFKGELKQVAIELNNISGGLSNAVEEAMKSERLKTELITNVSHDIKTPLTSIINYVDLMKKEEIDNEKVKEYLEVLDNKSQRLKKLTEDLVEASKVSSGNIKLNMETLKIKELIKQVGAEFEDKFKTKGLQVVENYPEEDICIEADSRYIYRVMENVYMNISKYALENSRVYIDVVKVNDNVQIALKNISKDKLNITVDELMQRFVRGDTSRTTEGSGLGISIAKSLTELQNGKFDIYLDGDLFKVIIEFKIK